MPAPVLGGYRRTPLDLADVQIDDPFWSPRQTLIRTQTLRQQERMFHQAGHFQALTMTWRPGQPNRPHIFWESDVAKWVEAASYCLATTEDPELEASVDRVIGMLAAAQQPDGYLNIYYTLVAPGHRFTDLRDAHELYCAGHLIEAGVAHHQATGRSTLLDVVRRYADLLVEVFGPDGPCAGGYCGHEEIELALVKLYRATDDRRYLELSRRMVDARGTQPFYFELEAERRGDDGFFGHAFPYRNEQGERFREYNQSHAPVTEQSAIVGHSVRAMYLLSGVTDLAAEYGDADLTAAAMRLWDDLVDTKLYLTGGVGADPSIEGFAGAYALPNHDGYAETCAAIGLVQWAARMNRLTGDARFVDVLERALYNGVLSGASADGTQYFYGNPLASDGDVHRHEWFGVACCPPNLARLVSELGHYLYAQGEDEVIINLYASSTARFAIGGQTVTVQQTTDYPVDGRIRLTVTPERAGARFAVRIRIPAWSTHTAQVNGEAIESDPVDGYLSLDRDWAPGDTVEIALDLAPRRVWANSQVTTDAGAVALVRGPFVYCLEGVDHATRVSTLVLPRDAALTEQIDPETGQVHLTAPGVAEVVEDRALYRSTPPTAQATRLTAVPYYQWGNRGQADMTVWIRDGVGA